MSEVLTKLSAALADRYRVEREVGAGAMATVYLAHDLKHDREVALKVLRPEIAAMLGAQRFLNEIRITAKLDHPHILTLIDSGAADGFLYYVLPFVRGESLRSLLLREKQLALADALAITKQIGSALDYAHGKGIVHRDIKPENILLHEGEAMLADFGIALAVKEAGGNRLTESGRSLGTPQYMSPEQATGDRALDARSDEYSLAAVLYEMLAGEPPHTGPNIQVIIAKLLTERPVRLRVLRDTVPEGIEAAVAKALAIVPADRYTGAGEFARALAVTAPAQPEPRRWQRWIPAAIGFGIAAAALGIAVVISRRTAPAPAVDRVQLTGTGNVLVPSISPDGGRLAFGERQCDSVGQCNYRLVIQDVDGSGRLVIADSIATLGSTEWTRDGRYLLFIGSYARAPWGTFALSTLGGAPRYLGCCLGTALGGDTALVFRPLALSDTLGWVIITSLRDAHPRDSIRIHEPGIRFVIVPTTYKDRLLVLVRGRDAKTRELRLIDYRGNVIDRTTAGVDVGTRRLTSRRANDSNDLLVALQHEEDSDEYDLVRLRVTPSRIDPVVDTIMQRVLMGDGWYQLSPDGHRLVYAVGPVETTIWSTMRDAKSKAPLTTSALYSSTKIAFARISPAGDRVLIGRQVVSEGRLRFQLFISPFDSWHESQVSSPVEDLIDVQWSPGSDRIVYANRIGTRTHVTEVDTAGRNAREIAAFDGLTPNGVSSLRDGRVALFSGDGRSIALTTHRGTPGTPRQVPNWLGHIVASSASPDGNWLGILGWNRTIDSAVIARVSLKSGAFESLAALPAEDMGLATWLNDGDFAFSIQEPGGSNALYTIRAGSSAKRITALPRAPAMYSLSADGLRLILTTQRDKKDIYMIQNFGDFLRR